ncbi:hypothetical protein [Streptomyces ardesiacus]|uniref:hypothetical protein n=1 Tax=Streptomyces ardesiacus TaxID=285564 RepID=UPI002FDC17E1
MADDYAKQAEDGARRQHAKECPVYSVAVALDVDEMKQQHLSKVIHRVEQQGWALDKVAAFSTGVSTDAMGHEYEGSASVLLIFRRV